MSSHDEGRHTATLLGCLHAVLDQPGVIDAIRARLGEVQRPGWPDAGRHFVALFDLTLDALAAWPEETELAADIDALADAALAGTKTPGVDTREPTETVWPTDLLKDTERHLARLSKTFESDDGDEDGLVHLSGPRAELLDAIRATLGQARAAADTLTPPADTSTIAELVRSVDYFREDLTRGLMVPDVETYEGDIGRVVEDTWARWEPAEHTAGRPPMSADEAVADITERLSWTSPTRGKPHDGTANRGGGTRAQLAAYTQPAGPRPPVAQATDTAGIDARAWFPTT